MKKNFLECGKLVAMHGIAGELRMQPWCEPEDLIGVKRLFLDPDGLQPVRVIRARPHKNVVILKLADVDTPEQAALLRGKVLYVDRTAISLLPGEYFIQDLIGMRVVDADDGRFYGTLTDVLETGANNVYQVTFPDGKDRLVPAIEQVVIERDVDAGIMRIRPMEGLFDDEN